MELDFDKDIDALLRKTVAGRGVLVGDDPKAHLDADTLSAFAENALPEKSRQLHMKHLADCDRCRKTLSSLIVLNAEAEPVAAVVAAPALPAVSIPWYRKLFSAPNLAYVMGALVLLFGGMIGLLVLQSTFSGDSATVSQVQDTQPAARPIAPESGSAAPSANSATNSNSATVNGDIPRTVGTTDTGEEYDAEPLATPEGFAANRPLADKNVSIDGVDLAKGGQPAPPAAAPKDLPRPAEDERERVMSKSKAAEEKAPVTTTEARKQDADTLVREQQLQTNPGGPMKSGPSRNEMQRDNRVYDDNKMRAKKESPRADTGFGVGSTAGKRQAGGKTFERDNGVWYDSAYRGQSTKNYRRGTSDYLRLDGGLRSIADNLGGTVVIVWQGKAYRIQ